MFKFSAMRLSQSQGCFVDTVLWFMVHYSPALL